MERIEGKSKVTGITQALTMRSFETTTTSYARECNYFKNSLLTASQINPFIIIKRFQFAGNSWEKPVCKGRPSFYQTGFKKIQYSMQITNFGAIPAGERIGAWRHNNGKYFYESSARGGAMRVSQEGL